MSQLTFKLVQELPTPLKALQNLRNLTKEKNKTVCVCFLLWALVV